MKTKKILQTIVETKVKNKTVLLIFVLVASVGISLIVSSLITPTGIANFPSVGGDDDTNAPPPPPPPISGWCVTGGMGAIGDNGIHTTKTSCKNRASDDNSMTEWYAFCPDIPGQGERTESSCDCKATDIEKSAKLEELISMRDGLIEALNDGSVTPDDAINQLRFGIATHINCACSVFNAGTKPASEREIRTLSVAGTTISGVHTFIRKVAIMFSKMNLYVAPGQCELLPPKCTIGRSYSGRGDSVPITDWNNRNTDDSEPHNTGQALDMNCQETAPAWPSGCTGNASTLLGKVSASSSGLNIIRECNTKEKKKTDGCPGDGGTTQLIHVDEKNRGDAGTDCFYSDCIWTCGTKP